jgi:N-acetylglucosaminyldiphosphoundecaprenol N-acetyl-beta-D-mannosaminyltransferase
MRPVADTFRTILGVRFYISDLEGLLDLFPNAGLIVVPSAPVMVRLEVDAAHREALEGADFAVTDSTLMVYLWLLKTGERLTRISGLRLLRGLFARHAYRGSGDTFWVMPSAGDSTGNLAWLKGQGFEVSGDDAYIAPLYPKSGPIADAKLVDVINARRPKIVFIALSGGVQERLGWELSQKLAYKPTILCIGGAIAFLSGTQTSIPGWADRLGLGWVLRFASAPGPFAAKLRGSERLGPLIWKYGSRSVGSG